MAGLLAAQKPESLSNKNLIAVEKRVESQMPPELKPQLDAAILSGEEVLFSDAAKSEVVKNMRKPDFLQTLPKSMASLILYIKAHSGQDDQGRPKMSDAVALPAAIVLSLHVLDVAEKVAGIEITPELVSNGVKILTQEVQSALSNIAPNPQQAAGQQIQQGA